MNDKPIVMTATNHAKFASHSAFYPDAGELSQREFDYLFLGLGGEAGESIDAYKKVIRALEGTTQEEFEDSLERFRDKILDELGDVYWYLNLLCLRLGTSPEVVMGSNYLKLTTRYNNTEAPHLLGIEGGGVNYEDERDG